MVERFAKWVQERGLIPQGSRVLVGYSGGADSTCLLHLIWRVLAPSPASSRTVDSAGDGDAGEGRGGGDRHDAQSPHPNPLPLKGGTGILGDSGRRRGNPEFHFSLVAAHLHHGQRPEADEELLKCEAFCQSLGIPFMSGRADVPEIARLHKIGLEEAGRQARYAFFEKAAKQMECDLIATAHTQSDLAESVLLNLARGTGMAGLAGIPERRDNIIRPLLGFSREETRAYCVEHGLWFHDDPANDDLALSRTRLRKKVIPELKALNPRVEEAIARAASVLKEEDAFLDGAAAAALEQAETPLNGELRFLTLSCEAAFRQPDLLHLPKVLRVRAVRLLFEAFGGSADHDLSMETAESLSQSVQGSRTAEGGASVIEWSEGVVHARALEVIEPFRYPLAYPGETDSEVFGWRFVAEPTPEAPEVQQRDSLSVVMDLTAVKGNLYFRQLEPGDRIQPLGFGSARKLSDVLGEAKLTQAARKRLPIVCDLAGPVWAPGVCMSDRVTPQRGSSSPREPNQPAIAQALKQKEGPVGRLLRLTFGPIIR